MPTQLGEMSIMPGARITLSVARHQDDHAHTVDAQVVPRDAQANTARTVTLPEDLAAKIWVVS